MEKVLITDISSFFGFHLKNHLYDHFEIYELGVDIKNTEKVKERLDQVRPDFIIHLGVGDDPYVLYEKDFLGSKTYQGMANLVNAAKDLESLKLLCFLNHNVKLKNEKSLARKACEDCLQYVFETHGINYSVLRTDYVYGNFFSCDGFLEKIFYDHIHGNQQSDINFDNLDTGAVFIDDFCQAIGNILNDIENFKNKIIQIRYDHPISISEIIDFLNNHFGFSLSFEKQILEEVESELENTLRLGNPNTKNSLEVYLQRLREYQREVAGM